jgi:hypothetical protein
MQPESVNFPITPIALKMAGSIGIDILAGMERAWSNKDVGMGPLPSLLCWECWLR